MLDVFDVNQIEQVTKNTLLYLKNDDGCWGEYKSQPSRFTNTCEVLWGLSYCNKDDLDSGFEIDKALSTIKKGILGENQTYAGNVFLNCDIARDYGWGLIALASWGCLESEVIDHAISKIKELQLEDGGFASRGERASSLFSTSIPLIGLCYLINKTTLDKSTYHDAISLLSDAAEQCVRLLVRNEYDDGEFPYAYYALGMANNHGSQIEADYVVKLNEMASGIDPNIISEERRSSRDLSGNKKPYRHFRNVWLLLGAIEFNHVIKHDLVNSLVTLFNKKKGWAYHAIGHELTWANAIALSAFMNYLSRLNVVELITHKKYNIASPLNGGVSKRQKEKIFIVHGHDEQDLLALNDLLGKEFSLTPVVAKNEASEGLEHVFHKVQRLIRSCYSAIILLTPDDMVNKDGETYMQARPNVIMEVGLCAEICDGRVIFLMKDGCDLFSDIEGLPRIEYVNIDNTMRELKKQLKAFGVIQ